MQGRSIHDLCIYQVSILWFQLKYFKICIMVCHIASFDTIFSDIISSYCPSLHQNPNAMAKEICETIVKNKGNSIILPPIFEGELSYTLFTNGISSIMKLFLAEIVYFPFGSTWSIRAHNLYLVYIAWLYIHTWKCSSYGSIHCTSLLSACLLYLLYFFRSKDIPLSLRNISLPSASCISNVSLKTSLAKYRHTNTQESARTGNTLWLQLFPSVALVSINVFIKYARSALFISCLQVNNSAFIVRRVPWSCSMLQEFKTLRWLMYAFYMTYINKIGGCRSFGNSSNSEQTELSFWVVVQTIDSLYTTENDWAFEYSK